MIIKSGQLGKMLAQVASVLFTFFIVTKAKGTEITILSNSKAEVEQFEKNQGRYLNVETNRIIFEKIKGDFTFSHEYLPRAREELKMGASAPICSINNIKTAERSEKYHFSLPVNLYSTLRLYQKGSNASLPSTLLDASGDLKSLVDLFAMQTDKNILLVKDIEYPAVLQKQIDSLDPAQVFFIKNSALNGENVLLIERGRANYIVDYPQVINDWYTKKGIKNKLTSYAISGLEPLVAGYIMCNESAMKSGVLLAINNSIRKLYQNGSFYDIYANYLNKEEVERINKYLSATLNLDLYSNDGF